MNSSLHTRQTGLSTGQLSGNRPTVLMSAGGQ